MTGRRTAAIHFKVQVIDTANGRKVNHGHLVEILHRNAMGHSSPYVINCGVRSSSYPYETLVAMNGPPNWGLLWAAADMNCPIVLVSVHPWFRYLQWWRRDRCSASHGGLYLPVRVVDTPLEISNLY